MGTTFLHNAWRHVAVACTMACLQPAYGQSIRLTTEELKNMYSTINMQRTSVHDPSVVFDEASQSYYIFGSHNATAKTTDLQNWSPVTFTWGAVNADGTETYNVEAAEAFHVNQTKEIRIGGQTVAFGDYDASAWNCALPGTDNAPWSVYGNMWAPDIIYNPAMKKWCQYLSLNGPTWNSCIILLTADRIEGPYVYQGPVVYTGFRNDTDERISFHKTDLELVIGPQTSLPARYRQENWGTFWPHAIDPCVFYDEEGQLWMSYGSWSGGIYMLQLDESTGLRDYDVAYPGDYDTRKQNVTSDPYFGKKIAGGWYVSGEGSYIEHIGNYYYLFMSYGGLNPNAGYEMRVFRSARPDGPYTDTQGTSAIFTNWRLNYGPNSDTRGEKLLGSYNHWGLMSVGECAQGHNSVLAAADGNTYLVYHTKFNDGTFGHQVRVHQLYQNADGWLVAAPFEYNGERVGDGQIATTRTFTDEEMAGTYRFLTHRYQLDHNNYTVGTIWDWKPVEVDGLPGVEVWGNIFGGDKVYDMVRKAFVKGMNSLSVAGESKRGRFQCDSRGCYMRRAVEQLLEISLCREPANRYAKMRWYNEDASFTKSADSNVYGSLDVRQYTIHRDYTTCPILGLRKRLTDAGFRCHATEEGVLVDMDWDSFVRSVPYMVDNGIHGVWTEDGVLMNSKASMLESSFRKCLENGWIDPDGRILKSMPFDEFDELMSKGLVDDGFRLNAYGETYHVPI